MHQRFYLKSNMCATIYTHVVRLSIWGVNIRKDIKTPIFNNYILLVQFFPSLNYLLTWTLGKLWNNLIQTLSTLSPGCRLRHTLSLLCFTGMETSIAMTSPYRCEYLLYSHRQTLHGFVLRSWLSEVSLICGQTALDSWVLTYSSTGKHLDQCRFPAFTSDAELMLN